MAVYNKSKRTFTKANTNNFKDREKEFNERLLEIDMERNLLEREQENYRGRSIAVGGSFNGVEVCIRMMNGHTAYQLLTPVETVELINTLAANIGCHVAVQPREDFSSYRDWSQYIPYDVKHDPNKLLATGSTFTKLEKIAEEDNKQELLFKD